MNICKITQIECSECEQVCDSKIENSIGEKSTGYYDKNGKLIFLK